MPQVPNQQDAAANSVVVRVPIPQPVQPKQQQPPAVQPAQTPPSNPEGSAQTAKQPTAFILPYLPAAVDKVRYSRNDVEAFLDRIASQPGDKVGPLVFADWIEEQGHSALAELIRRSHAEPHEEHPLDAAGLDFTHHPLVPPAGHPARGHSFHGLNGRLAFHTAPNTAASVEYHTTRLREGRNAVWFSPAKLVGTRSGGNPDDHRDTVLADIGRPLLTVDPALVRRLMAEATIHHNTTDLWDTAASHEDADARLDRELPSDEDAAHSIQPHRYAARKAPPNGVIHRGLFYEGGSFLPDMPAGQPQQAAAAVPQPKEPHPRTRLVRQLRKLLAARRSPLRYAADDRTTPHPPERPDQPTPDGLKPFKAHGQSGSYFRDATHFYKKPDLDHDLHVEPAAAKFFKLLGVHNVVEPEHVSVGGEGYLRAPDLSPAFPLFTYPKDKLPAELHPTRDQLVRHALATYLSHSNDRHYGNVVIANGGLHHIDFGNAFHPLSGNSRKPVHPHITDALVEEFGGGPIRIPHGLLREAVAKKPELRKLVEEGTKSMAAQVRHEALDLFERKMSVVAKLRGVLEPTTYHLPPFDEHGNEGEPYAE